VSKVPGIFGVWNIGVRYVDDAKTERLAKAGGEGAPKKDRKNFVQELTKLNQTITLDKDLADLAKS
jgi:hypothetical protein